MKKLREIVLVILIALAVFYGCKGQELKPIAPELEVIKEVPEPGMVAEKPVENIEKEEEEAANKSDFLAVFRMTGDQVFKYFNNDNVDYGELKGLTLAPREGVYIYFMDDKGQPFGYGAGRLDEENGNTKFWSVYREEYLEDSQLLVYWLILKGEGLADFVGTTQPVTLEMLNEKMGQVVELEENPFFGEGVYSGTYNIKEVKIYADFTYPEESSTEEPVLALETLRFDRDRS